MKKMIMTICLVCVVLISGCSVVNKTANTGGDEKDLVTLTPELIEGADLDALMSLWCVAHSQQNRTYRVLITSRILDKLEKVDDLARLDMYADYTQRHPYLDYYEHIQLRRAKVLEKHLSEISDIQTLLSYYDHIPDVGYATTKSKIQSRVLFLLDSPDLDKRYLKVLLSDLIRDSYAYREHEVVAIKIEALISKENL